jgi:hypothetical protein
MVRLVRQCMSLDKDRIMFFSFFVNLTVDDFQW